MENSVFNFKKGTKVTIVANGAECIVGTKKQVFLLLDMKYFTHCQFAFCMHQVGFLLWIIYTSVDFYVMLLYAITSLAK